MEDEVTKWYHFPHNHHNQSRKNSLTMSDVVVPTIPHLAREEESQWPGDRKVTK